MLSTNDMLTTMLSTFSSLMISYLWLLQLSLWSKRYLSLFKFNHFFSYYVNLIWQWPSLVEIGLVVLEMKFFLISSMYFRYFIISFPLKWAGPFSWIKLNPIHPRMLCANWVEIGSLLLKKMICKFRQYIFAIS